jgi:predicted membrane-bound mannosyltransferase
LAFSSPPDFEGQVDSDLNNKYIVIVTVSDGALTDTQSLTVTITNANESSTVGAPTFSAATVKGVTLTISIATNVSGRARFFVNGKRIPACLARATSGTYPNFIVTCTWKPPVIDRHSVSASFTPTDNTFSASNSPVAIIQVLKRGGTR